jgi:hypothetical protein
MLVPPHLSYKKTVLTAVQGQLFDSVLEVHQVVVTLETPTLPPQ